MKSSTVNRVQCFKMDPPTAQLIDEHEVALEPEPTGDAFDRGIALKEAGNSALRAGQYQEAAERYREALLIFSGRTAERANCLSNYAAACVRLGELDEAERTLREAIDINPRHINARLRIARVFSAKEKHILAASEWGVVAQIRPLTDSEAAERDVCNKKAMDAGITTMKSWGNKLLGKLGLSLDNFKLAKNSDGSFNISMQK
ncbi:Tetratricopeptide repeat protein/ TPR repeat family [Giardia duodenalis assemblage B]|uniref:Tetratricopeptide repeat protein/ TPR repeat family n=1 Tax=Giardia duodenalis assemblage B TaxID=1394984 RepID=A0A132P006_GIAIN|nr:Tetratricopeptide repeat protein/ TPR repeat family [Giardia intestinalis assemblage B]